MNEESETIDLHEAYQPVSTSAFDDWSIQIVDEWETSRGIGFSADVFEKGNHVFSLENTGDGGCNRYLTGGAREPFRRFESLSKEQYPAALEPVDTAVMWLEIRDLDVPG